MAKTRKPAGHSPVSAWWLLLIPAVLLAGHYLGLLHLPTARGTVNTPVTSAPASAGALPSPPEASVNGGVRWVALSSAIQEARASGKAVMFDFNAAWCPPCKLMKRQVFENADYARSVEAAVVPVSVVDRWRETGTNPQDVAELQQRFRIEAFPTLVVMSPTTGRYVSQTGFGGAEYTAKWIASAAQQVQQK